MKRPLTVFLLFYILGILIGHYAQNWVINILFLIISTITCLYFYLKRNIIEYIIIPPVFILGIVMIYINTNPINNELEQLAAKEAEVTMTGIATDSSMTQNKTQKITLKTNNIGDEKLEKAVTIQVYINEQEHSADIGDKITIKGELRHFDYQRNPGGFNEKLYNKTKKIDYKMYAKLLKVEEGPVSLNEILKKFRRKISNVYDNVLPEKEASILKAMVIGDKSELDEDIRELYSNAGISHILAISGLHISTLTLMLLKAFEKIKVNKRKASILILLFLILYTIFIGASVSAVRATLMMSLVLIGNILFRKQDSITSISFAGLALLLYQPLNLWDIGFQLSFTAALGLILLSSSIIKIMPFPKVIKEPLGSTLAACIATYPITTYHFYEISIIALIVNIFILPFVSFLLCVGIAIGIAGLISNTIAVFLAGSVYFILKFYENLCIIATNIPFSNIVTGKPLLITLILYYCIIILIIFNSKSKNKCRIYRKAALMISICVFIFHIIIISIIPKQLEVVFLDVGQGDCIIIHSPDNTNIIIDGGGNIQKELGSNTGIKTVYPYLKYKGISTIDIAIITHSDADHSYGIIELFELVEIENLILPNVEFIENKVENIIKEQANKNNIPTIKMQQDDKFTVNKKLTFTCLYPLRKGETPQKIQNPNNGSLVLKMKYENTHYLFTGDIEEADEKLLINANSPLKSEILKIAHHGSKTSTTTEFLQAVTPQQAIISSGRNNTYGHPSKETIEKLKTINTDIYNTADVGAITIKHLKKQLEIKTMKQQNKW